MKKRSSLISWVLGLWLLSVASNVLAVTLVQSGEVQVIRGHCRTSDTPECELKKNSQGQLEGLQVCHAPYGDKSKIFEVTYSAGELNGFMKCWMSNQPSVEASFKDGKLDGAVKTGWEKDLKAWTNIKDYKAGLLHGPSVSSEIESSQGRSQILSQLVKYYEMGKEHGYTFRMSDGAVTSVSECYVHGVYSDKMEDCARLSLGSYSAAVQAFLQKQKSASTAACNTEKKVGFTSGMMEVYQQKDCKKFGASVLFAKDGKTKVVETNYVDGLREGEQKVYFEQEGLTELRVSELITYKKDRPQKLLSYYQNGKPKLEITFKALNKWQYEMEYKEFNDRGQLTASGTTRNKRELADGGHPMVTDFDLYSFIGCQSRYDESKKVIEQYCYNSEHKRDGRSFFYKKDQDPVKPADRYEQEFKGDVLVSEKRFEGDSDKLLSSKQFFPDGSLKSEDLSPR